MTAGELGLEESPGWLARLLPVTVWLPHYRRSSIRPDLMAALTVWALLVPEAMAYAAMAGMPPEYGLYAVPGALLGNAVFGSSRQLIVGPSSTVAILSASAVAGVAVTTRGDFIAISAELALLIGTIYVMLGLARMGWVSRFLSKSVLTGFTFGLALTIAVGQASKLFGVEPGRGNFFEKLGHLLRELPNANAPTTAVGLSSLAVLFFVRARFGHRVPAALLVVGVSIALSSAFDWQAHGVAIIGAIPAGLPSLHLPQISWHQLTELVMPAVGIVLVGYAESYAGARSLAARHRQRIEPDQEMIALGAANIGSALAGGFTVDASLSRSAAADEAGAKSQMTGLICLTITLVTIVALLPHFHNLPEAVLGAVVIWAVWGLFNVTELRRIARSNRYDLLAALGALVGVCVFGLLPGLMIAVAISLLTLIYRSSQPRMTVLARDVDQNVFVARKRWDTADVPGVTLLRFEAPLFFANAGLLGDRLRQLASRRGVTVVVLDCEAISSIDTDGADELGHVSRSLREQGVDFRLARASHACRKALRRTDVYDTIGADHVHLSVRDAVTSATGTDPGELDIQGSSEDESDDPGTNDTASADEP